MTKKIAIFALIATLGLGVAPTFADDGTPEELGQVTLVSDNFTLAVSEIQEQDSNDSGAF